MIDVFRNRQEHGAAFDADFLEEMKFRYASGIDAASGQSGEEAEVIPVATVQPTIVYNDFNMELLLALRKHHWRCRDEWSSNLTMEFEEYQFDNNGAC
ncbi:hypothetical protein MHU86_16488 [Fragilaria crotonensis]|nr:hypothetical protein MHU86_16488 [Fragilaria crotonensis]